MSHSREEITTAVVDILQDACAPEGVTVTADTAFGNQVPIDSMTLVQLDVLFRDRLQLALPLEHVQNLTSVEDLVNRLVEHGVPADPAD